jgi:hypothetical protein
MKTLINWSSVSEALTGDRTRVSLTRCPKKYKAIVEKIVFHENEIKKIIEKTSEL